MPNNAQESAMMICYRECLANLEKFSGGEERKCLQFINNIERIGKMVDATDNILHCMCTAKLDGEAKRWYEDNMSLTGWENLKSALIERFTTSDLSSRIFEQLKECQQKSDETITSYYDAVIKLCREYDLNMPQKMMISWLENGVKDSLRTQIKRQMKSLSESARTTQAFLKIAKDEEELQETHRLTSEPTTSYAPYFVNTVSTTLTGTENTRSDVSIHTPSSRTTRHRELNTDYHQYRPPNASQRPPRTHLPASQKNSFEPKPQSSAFRGYQQTSQLGYGKPPNSLNIGTRQFKYCSICQRNNHYTRDCYYKKQYGCYKCGQSDHRIRDCPQVFY